MVNYKFLFLNILNKKKLCKFSIFIFGIMIFLFSMSLFLKNGINKKYEQIKKENIISNYIIIKSDKGYNYICNDLEKIKGIKYYRPLLYLKIDELYIMYAEKDIINISSGNYIINDNEIVIPKKFDKKVGDILNLNFNNKTYEFVITGKYTENNFKFSINNEIKSPLIVSNSFIKNIVNVDNLNELMVVVENYDDIDNIINQIRKYEGYEISIYDANKTFINRYKDFSNMVDNLSKILVVFSFLGIILVNCFIYYDHKKDIAIFKSLGYSNVKIFSLLFFYSALLLSICYAPITIITLVITFLFNNIFDFNIIIILGCYILFLFVTFLSLSIINLFGSNMKIRNLLN